MPYIPKYTMNQIDIKCYNAFIKLLVTITIVTLPQIYSIFYSFLLAIGRLNSIYTSHIFT